MQTDPEGRGFKCISGVRQKIETYDASDAEVIDVPTEEERMAIANDPFRSLERVRVLCEMIFVFCSFGPRFYLRW